MFRTLGETRTIRRLFWIAGYGAAGVGGMEVANGKVGSAEATMPKSTDPSRVATRTLGLARDTRRRNARATGVESFTRHLGSLVGITLHPPSGLSFSSSAKRDGSC